MFENKRNVLAVLGAAIMLVAVGCENPDPEYHEQDNDNNASCCNSNDNNSSSNTNNTNTNDNNTNQNSNLAPEMTVRVEGEYKLAFVTVEPSVPTDYWNSEYSFGNHYWDVPFQPPGAIGITAEKDLRVSVLEGGGAMKGFMLIHTSLLIDAVTTFFCHSENSEDCNPNWTPDWWSRYEVALDWVLTVFYCSYDSDDDGDPDLEYMAPYGCTGDVLPWIFWEEGVSSVHDYEDLYQASDDPFVLILTYP